MKKVILPLVLFMHSSASADFSPGKLISAAIAVPVHHFVTPRRANKGVDWLWIKFSGDKTSKRVDAAQRQFDAAHRVSYKEIVRVLATLATYESLNSWQGKKSSVDLKMLIGSVAAVAAHYMTNARRADQFVDWCYAKITGTQDTKEVGKLEAKFNRDHAIKYEEIVRVAATIAAYEFTRSAL